MIKVSFTLIALLCQNVAVISMLSLEFTRSGKSESFFGTGISLCFRHFVETLNITKRVFQKEYESIITFFLFGISVLLYRSYENGHSLAFKNRGFFKFSVFFKVFCKTGQNFLTLFLEQY